MEELPDLHVTLLNLGSSNEKTKFKSAYFILAENANFIPTEINFLQYFLDPDWNVFFSYRYLIGWA